MTHKSEQMNNYTPFDRFLLKVGKIPGALMIVPLFLGVVVNTVIPEALLIGSFTTALFKNGLAVLIGLFFLSVGSQITFKAALPSVEKGLVLLLAKFGIAALFGLSVAFFFEEGVFLGMLPLAIIAAMSNSNGSLYVALTSQFGNRTDKGAISILSINDGPFLTLVALGVAGLAAFPLMALFSAVFPMIFGFILGNISSLARKFLEAGEKLIIPFAAFAIGASINLQVLVGEGSIGVILGLVTVIFSGGAAIASLYMWHVVRRHPGPTRNLVSAASEASVAGNAIATPAVVAALDPSYVAVQDAATAQIAAAVVVTAFVLPFFVAWFANWQKRRGVTPENEEAFYESNRSKRL
jgi:2-keto-3-deoxygluconate permease